MHRSSLRSASLPAHSQHVLFCADLVTSQLCFLTQAPSPTRAYHATPFPELGSQLARHPRLLSTLDLHHPPLIVLSHRFPQTCQALNLHSNPARKHLNAPVRPLLLLHITSPPRVAAPRPAPPASRRAALPAQRNGPSRRRHTCGDGELSPPALARGTGMDLC